MPQFLTVPEAAALVERSSSSIRRRVIYPIIERDDHPDRHHIEPSVEDATKLRTQGENFAWKISDELLRRIFPANESTEKGSESSSNKKSFDGESGLLSMLRRELDIKNQQISQQSEMLSRQMELINGLSERLREGNLLIGTLQQRLSLGDGSSRATTPFVDAEPMKQGAGEPSPKKQTKAKAKPQKSKRRFFLFR